MPKFENNSACFSQTSATIHILNMLLSKIVQLAFVLSASCFTIPEGQADGVYSVSVNEDGTEVHTLLGINTETSSDMSTRSSRIKSRQLPGYFNTVSCGGYYLNVVDTNNANAALDRQYALRRHMIACKLILYRCGNGAWVGGGLDFYSIAGVSREFCNVLELLHYVLKTHAPIFTRVVHRCILLQLLATIAGCILVLDKYAVLCIRTSSNRPNYQWQMWEFWICKSQPPDIL